MKFKYFLAIVFVFHCLTMSAQVNLWDGEVDSNWENAMNWVGDTLPATGEDIDIDSLNNYTGALAEPVISIVSSFSPGKIDIFNGADLTINADLSTSDNIRADGSGHASSLTINSGTINSINKHIDIKDGAIITINGGTINAKDLKVTKSAKGYFHGGIINATNDFKLEENVTFVMDENTSISVLNVNSDNDGAGQFKVKAKDGGDALFQLDAGTVTIYAGDVGKSIEFDADEEGANAIATIEINGGSFTNHGDTQFKKGPTDNTIFAINGGEVLFVGMIADDPGNEGKIQFEITGGEVNFGGPIFLETEDIINQSNNGTIIFSENNTISNNGTIFSTGDTIIFNGNTTLDGTGTYVFNHVEMKPTYSLVQDTVDLSISGDWINDGTFTTGPNNIHFIGTTGQSIGGSNSTTFEKLVINNTSAQGVVLNNTITVNASLELTDGVLFSSQSNYIILIDDATSNEGSNDSYVDGMFVKVGDDAFIFPVGDNDVWARFGISAPPTSNATFRVIYVNETHSDTENLTDVENISSVEHWLISGSNGTASVQPTIYWENGGSSGIEDINELKIAKYNGSWKDETLTNGVNGNASSGRITAKNVVNYSAITFASGDKNTNPLPIDLLSFNAELEGSQVSLKWVTVAEINNDYFTIERSRDGTYFKEFFIESGAGNSNSTITYHAYDESPYQGDSYYRLKQTDFDGKFTYSDIQHVFVEPKESSAMTIFPNPSNQNQIYADIAGSNENSVLMIEILDSQGRSVFKEYINLNGITAQIDLDPSLPKGMYHITTMVGNKRLQQKFLRN